MYRHRFSIAAATLLVAALWPLLLRAASRPQMSNLVVFVAFQDEEPEPFVHDMAFYERLFNDPAPGANSVYAYFRHSSYGSLSWTSSFCPAPAGGSIRFYRTAMPKGYYQPKGEINTLGYSDDVEAAAREQALAKEIGQWLDSNVPADVSIDADGDGFVDNVTLVFAGASDVSSRYKLWPHRSDLIASADKAVTIHGKKMVSFIMVFDRSNGFDIMRDLPITTGVLCHEMSHSLGTYDLYHAADRLSPVGVWDLMADNQDSPQQMLAYTKWRYCRWIDDIPEISQPGTYTLHPVGGDGSGNVAYRIKPTGSDEYFVVEYRRREGYDGSIPRSGLIVYRINPAYTGGNVNYNGTTRLDETYVFRPGGTTTADGAIADAALSSDYGRSSFGIDPSFAPFYSNGERANFAIDQIGPCGPTISFRLLEAAKRVYVARGSLDVSAQAGSTASFELQADQPWRLAEAPSWLTVTPGEGPAGTATITVTAATANVTARERSADLVFVGTDDATQADTITIRQPSNLIQAPTGLEARPAGQGVELVWRAPLEGAPLLANDFEGDDSLDGWLIENSDDRGWQRQQSGKHSWTKAHGGTRSVWLNYGWDPVSEDQRLTSPSFAGGSWLTFWSKSTAPGSISPVYHYVVEASADGGQTWHTAFDLIKEGKAKNRYEQITVDLGPYRSDNMKIRFHAWDESEGLAYWWTIDDVAVYPEAAGSMVEGYNIYRDGTLIGTSATTSFVDAHPADGTNTYRVTARGSFGETMPSDPAAFDVATAVAAAQAEPGPVVDWRGGVLTVSAPGLTAVGAYSADGRPVGRVARCNGRATLWLPGPMPLIVRMVVGGRQITRKCLPAR